MLPPILYTGRRGLLVWACCGTLLASAACEDGDAGDTQPADGGSVKFDAAPGCDGDCADADIETPVADAGSSQDAGEPDAHVLDASVTLDAAVDAAAPDADLPDAEPEFDAGDMQAVTLRFGAKLGDSNFACGQRYQAQGSSAVAVTPIDFRFFVQQVRLIRADGVEVPLLLAERAPWQTRQVALLDFEDGSGSCVNGNAGTNRQVTGWAPPAAYTGVVVVQGIPAALNHADPASAPAPLRNAPATLWSWTLGYKFLLAELAQLDASGAPGLGLVHVGSMGCTGSGGIVECTRSNRPELRFEQFDLTRDTIVADLSLLFAATDLTQDNQCHATGSTCADAYTRLGLNYATGQATPASQQVYRVE